MNETFVYTGGVQKHTLSAGTYNFYLWGASGGSGGYCSPYTAGTGGKGGFVKGKITVDKTTNIFIYVGGQGVSANGCAWVTISGGFNGGGYLYTYGAGTTGGGASDIRFDSDNLQSRVIVAGAGGGAGIAYDSGNNGGLVGGDGGGDVGSCGTCYGSNSASRSGGNQQNGGNGNGGNEYNGGLGKGGNGHGGSHGGGSGGGGYYGGGGVYHAWCPGCGGSSYISSKFTETVNQQGVHTGNGKVIIEKLSYNLKLLSTLEKRYDPGTMIALDFNLNSYRVGDKARIFLNINDSAESDEEVVLVRLDDGKSYNFTSRLNLPSKSGKLKLTYKCYNDANSKFEISYEIMVNKLPQITVFTELKSKYVANDNVYVTVEALDDTKVTLFIADELRKYTEFPINCYNDPNKTTYHFNIPDYSTGTRHTIYIFAVDEFGFNSTIFESEYTISESQTPEVFIRENISYYYFAEEIIIAKIAVRDLDTDPETLLYTSLDNTYITTEATLNLADDDWRNISISRSLKQIDTGPHKLRIFAVDSRQGESNKIVHEFHVLPNKLKITCANNEVYTSILMRSLLFLDPLMNISE